MKSLLSQPLKSLKLLYILYPSAPVSAKRQCEIRNKRRNGSDKNPHICVRVLAILLYFHRTIAIGAVKEDVFPMGK